MSGSGRIWLDTHRFVYLVPESEPETIIFSRRRLFFHRSRNWFKSNRLRNTGGGWLGLCEGASNVVGCGGWCFKFIRLFAILKVLLTIMVSDMVSLEFFFIPVQYIVRFRNKVILFYIYECLYRYGTLCVKWFPYAVLSMKSQYYFYLSDENYLCKPDLSLEIRFGTVADPHCCPVHRGWGWGFTPQDMNLRVQCCGAGPFLTGSGSRYFFSLLRLLFI